MGEKLKMPHVGVRGIIGNALQYWEWRRIAYNGVLTLGALCWIFFTWPHFRPGFNLRNAEAVGVLTLLANVCYSAVYLADIPAQFSSLRLVWLRWRWSAFVLGALFALALEMYWIADEMY